MSCDLFIFAGEKSGDLHGASLIKELKKKAPHLKIEGVGGPLMRQEGFNCWIPMERFEVMGFVDVLLALPKLLPAFYTIAHQLLRNPPRLILLIDYPGFNLRLARYLKKRQISSKLCHFICPSIWAHGQERLKWMEESLDLLLLIFPFEQALFKNSPLPVLYVGNPIVTKIQRHIYRPLQDTSCKTLALFPGSRRQEIHRNLKLQLQVCQKIRKQHPHLRIALSLASGKLLKPILKIASDLHFTFDEIVPPERTYDLMQEAYLAIATSGTVTLELALHRVPTLVIYQVSWLELLIVRHILKVNLPFYALPNIVAQREIFPELYGPHLQEETLFEKICSLLEDQEKYSACQQQCAHLQEILGKKDASSLAAEALLQQI